MDPTSSTPLLPLSSLHVRDHPIQLRICHSSWKCFPQNVLVYIRAFVLAYLIVLAVMIANYKLNEPSEFSNWHLFFDFAVISFAILLLYHIVAFAWTYTHLYHPHIEEHKPGWEYTVLRLMSLPSDMAGMRKQFYCSLFFITTQVYSIMNSAIFWLEKWAWKPHAHPEVASTLYASPLFSNATLLGNATAFGNSRLFSNNATLLGNATLFANTTLFANATLLDFDARSFAQTIIATGPPISDFFGDDWFNVFCRLNLYVIAPMIAFFEMFFFSSVKRPIRTLGIHAIGIIVLTALYLGWASIGVVLTGWYPFHWLNAEEVGSREAVALYAIAFLLFSVFIFAVVQLILALRESLQKMAKQHRIHAVVEEAVSAVLSDD